MSATSGSSAQLADTAPAAEAAAPTSQERAAAQLKKEGMVEAAQLKKQAAEVKARAALAAAERTARAQEAAAEQARLAQEAAARSQAAAALWQGVWQAVGLTVGLAVLGALVSEGSTKKMSGEITIVHGVNSPLKHVAEPFRSAANFFKKLNKRER